MKRPISSSDEDLRGRIRREPKETDSTPLVEAKFLDGPIGGQTRLVKRGADYVIVGPWTYSYAGREGRTPLYCKQPALRVLLRWIRHIVSQRGADPRVARALSRSTPVRGLRLRSMGEPSTKVGQGARKRAAARA